MPKKKKMRRAVAMAQDTEKGSEESTATKSTSGMSQIQKKGLIVLVVLFIISSIYLMMRYSQNIYNSAGAMNATATAQEQTGVAERATGTSITIANAATEEAGRNMTATAIAKVNATAKAEAGAAQIPYPPSTGPDIDDPLNDNNNADLQWGTDKDTYGNCSFTDGKYQIMAMQRRAFEFCQATPINFANFIYEVQMRIIQGDGSDGGGLIFRAVGVNKFYQFLVNQDSSYSFSVFDLSRSENGTVLSSGSSQFIQPGLNITNTIAVVVDKNFFQLYVNHYLLAVVGDNNYSRGSIGLCANYASSPDTVVFEKVKVWMIY